MPIPTPIHARTSSACYSMRWKDWAGFYAVCSYGANHEREYYALRHSAGLIDVSPLFKYEVVGADGGRFLSRVMVKEISKMKVGQVTYCCWCDDQGKVIDDGTVSKLAEDHFRVTSAEPSLHWFSQFARGYLVKLEDSSQKYAALSLQGPCSRDVLKGITSVDMAGLKFFHVAKGKLDGIDVYISRTGYTGDLGYEIWVESAQAVKVWDAVMAAGMPYQLLPVGLDAMDMTRIEAGFIMNGVDYYSANHCFIESRKSSPYELGLGKMVKLDREPFIGQEALRREQAKGSKMALVGLEIDWVEVEALFNEYDLPPGVSSNAWRTAVPIYNSTNEFIGYATSGSWSPILKKNLALATVERDYGKVGNRLKIEVTVEYRRKVATATVVETPFYNPERKRL